MDHDVFVSPLDILHSLYLDLAEPGSAGGGYMIKRLPKDGNSTVGYKLSVIFNFHTLLVPSGHICLDASAEQNPSSEAVKSILSSVLQTLRQEYNIFNSDYSYAVISEKIALYDEMQKALVKFSKAYWQLDAVLEDCYKAIHSCYGGLSLCLNSLNMPSNVSAIEAVGALQGWLSATAGSIKTTKSAENTLVAQIMDSDPPPESLTSLKRTTTVPMIVHWEASYHVLKLLFDTCLLKMNAQASVIDIIPLGEASYQACIHLSFEPNEFLGEPAGSAIAAKAKLLYSVLRHIDSMLGFRIMDVNHSASEYIKQQIEKFDGKMEAISLCGKHIEELARSCYSGFITKSAIGVHGDSPDSSEQLIVHTLHSCASQLQSAMSKLHNARINFIYSKADRAFLELHVQFMN